MHELLGAADAADQKEAEQLLVAVVAGGASMEAAAAAGANTGNRISANE
jgi:hypothetical protein